MENEKQIYNNIIWKYCFLISLIVCVGSLISYLVLWGLIILLNLTALVLNVIATILGFIIIISFIIICILTIMRDILEKEIK